VNAAPQLELPIEPAPRDADALLARLRQLGLRDADRVRLTANRSVMVSYHDRVLSVHRAYLDAPRDVHAAIVRLVQAHRRAARNEARRAVLAFPVPLDASAPRRPTRARAPSPREARAMARLAEYHAELNTRHFGGALKPIAIRLSDRMRTRLGHFSPAQRGDEAHIAISRRHLFRGGWAAALETLLHEMVHQWQSENGLPLDHRRRFRAKARAVGLALHSESGTD
jgi:hypothetical protein